MNKIKILLEGYDYFLFGYENENKIIPIGKIYVNDFENKKKDIIKYIEIDNILEKLEKLLFEYTEENKEEAKNIINKIKSF